jgi:hydrogenase expression/formation protein HypC
MCVAYPVRVVSVGPAGAETVDARGRTRHVVLLALDDDPPAPGDWLLVQCGLAVAGIDADEAAARTRLLDEVTEGAPR